MEGKHSKWDWVTCNYHLKTEIGGRQTTWNLSPQIILTNPQQDGPDPNVRLFIDTEKSLEYQSEVGWSWHKSWNLPNISVRLEIKDPNTGELLLAPKNLYSQIFAVKAVLDHQENFHLMDVGIRGVNKIELIDGHAFFTALKFASTSYNNEGVKFHLVLTLYIMNDDNQQPQVLNSTISPPIFVDSRKQAKDVNIIMEKKMSSFVEPFLPETLEKIYIKRENKKKNDAEIQIINNFDGLYSYLTAPNIRHKVKHPLFLFLKFTECVKLYYNKKLFPDLPMKAFIETLQKEIYQDHQYKRMGSGNIKLDDKHFILQIAESTDTFKNKKIVEAMEPLQCASLGILYHFQTTPPADFEELSYARNDILTVYKQVQGSLYCSERQNEKEEEEASSEDEKEDEQVEKIIKKVHVDEEIKNDIERDEPEDNGLVESKINGEQATNLNYEISNINNEKLESNLKENMESIKKDASALSEKKANQSESSQIKAPINQQSVLSKDSQQQSQIQNQANQQPANSCKLFIFLVFFQQIKRNLKNLNKSHNLHNLNNQSNLNNYNNRQNNSHNYNNQDNHNKPHKHIHHHYKTHHNYLNSSLNLLKKKQNNHHYYNSYHFLNKISWANNLNSNNRNSNNFNRIYKIYRNNNNNNHKLYLIKILKQISMIIQCD